MGDQPYTDAELEAGAEAIARRAPYPLDVPHREAARVALRAVLPLHAARIRREVAEEIAADLDAWQATGISPRTAAKIARAHTAASGAPNSAPDAPNQLRTEGDQNAQPVE